MPTLGLNLARTLVLVLALAGATAGTAAATGGGGGGGGPAPAGPTLQGENLFASFPGGLTVTSDCVEENGRSTVSYHAEGVATGPFFPATFIVDGTITIDPQSIVNPPIGQGTIGGPIFELMETFTIFSGETRIDGEKTLAEPLVELGERERATCQDVTFLQGITGTGRVVEIEAATRYSATISGPTGTFTDSGRATVVLDLVEITGRCVGGAPCESRSGTFDELFTLSDQTPPPPPPPPPCEDDGDDDGDDDCDDG